MANDEDLNPPKPSDADKAAAAPGGGTDSGSAAGIPLPPVTPPAPPQAPPIPRPVADTDGGNEAAPAGDAGAGDTRVFPDHPATSVVPQPPAAGVNEAAGASAAPGFPAPKTVEEAAPVIPIPATPPGTVAPPPPPTSPTTVVPVPIPAPAASAPQPPAPPPPPAGYQPPAPPPPPPGYQAPAATWQGAPGWQTPPAGPPGTPAAGPRPYPVSSNSATVALILALSGFVAWAVCPGLGPLACSIIALVFASKGAKEIKASNGWITGSGLVLAARVIAWIDIALVILGLLFFVLFFVIAGASGGLDPNTWPTPSSTPTFSF